MIYLLKSGLKLKNVQLVGVSRLIRFVDVTSKNGFMNFAKAESPTTNGSKKYNRAPPIDLKSVRVNQGTNYKKSDDTSVPRSSGKLAAIIFLSIPIITFSLGVWQIYRRENKLKLIEYLDNRTRSQPIDLPSDPKELETIVQKYEYKPFKAKGYFLHSKEVVLTMRHDLTQQTHLPGGFVITPFVLSSNPNVTILVNRGFVPHTHFSPVSRSAAQVEGEVELVGLLRSNEPANAFTPSNVPPNEWHYRDVKQMSQALGTMPIFLDAVKSTTIKGGPLAGQTAIQLRNDHLIYIATWFSLSLLTSFLWWRRFKPVFF